MFKLESQLGNFFIRQFQFLTQNLLNDTRADRLIAMQRHYDGFAESIPENMMTAAHTLKSPSFTFEQRDKRLSRKPRKFRQAKREGWRSTVTEEQVLRETAHDRLPQCTTRGLSSSQQWPLPWSFLHRTPQHREPMLPISVTRYRTTALWKSLIACPHYSTRFRLMQSPAST